MGDFMKLSGILIACALTFSSLAFSAENISVAVSDVGAQQRLSYNFGRVWTNTMHRVVYNIRNTGTTMLVREGFSISGHGYDAYTNCPNPMAPGVVCDLEIRFWPAFEGHHFGRMMMLFTDKNDIIIDLFGEAYRM